MPKKKPITQPNFNRIGLGENIGRNPSLGPGRASRFFQSPQFMQIMESLAPLLVAGFGGTDMGYGALQGIQGQQDYRRQLGQDQLRRQQAEEERAYRNRQIELEEETLRTKRGTESAAQKEKEEASISDAMKELRVSLSGMDRNDTKAVSDLIGAFAARIPDLEKRQRFVQFGSSLAKLKPEQKERKPKYYAHPKGEGIIEQSPQSVAKYGTGEYGLLGFQGPYSERGGAEFQARSIKDRLKPKTDQEIAFGAFAESLNKKPEDLSNKEKMLAQRAYKKMMHISEEDKPTAEQKNTEYWIDLYMQGHGVDKQTATQKILASHLRAEKAEGMTFEKALAQAFRTVNADFSIIDPKKKVQRAFEIADEILARSELKGGEFDYDPATGQITSRKNIKK